MIFGLLLVVRAARIRYGLVYAALGVAAWVALFFSGVDPLVIGLAMGLLTYAYTPALDDLERATGLFRRFREQPTPELARSASAGLSAALSPNERLLLLYHPWTSYVIVPLFALANVGIVINGEFLARAVTSPITLGILVGYVAGKPIGIVGALLACHPAQPRSAPSAGRMGRHRGHGSDRRHRLHGVTVDRDDCLRRRAARGGQARRAVRGAMRVAVVVGGVRA